MKKINTKKLTVMGVICALAFICVLLFRFEVGGFLTFDIKDAVLTIASLIYGPLAGLICSFTVTFLEFVLISDTGVYGFIMNFLSSAALSCIAGLIYKYRRTMLGAVIGIVFAVFGVTAVMLLANLFITPLFLNMERSAVVGMILPLLLPFNIIKAVFNSALVLLIYKPFTVTLKKAKLLDVEGSAGYKLNFKSVLLMVISLIVLIGALLFLFLNMGGTIDLF
ncbi:MAG: ECF transporter S component [Clostridia bacterium]|nr:ECF transporter S component [Clostridia bacterium]